MPSAKIENTTPFTTYTMTVQAKNAIGAGPKSPPVEAQFNYNQATGGTETIVENYNGTTETWKVHTFTGNGTLDVLAAINPFRVLVAAGGGGGSHQAGLDPGVHGYSTGGGGGAGGLLEDDAFTITPGSHSITVGGGGGAAAKGGNSVAFGMTAIGGGQGGGNGGSGGSGGGSGYHPNGGTGWMGGPGTPGQGHNGSQRPGGGGGAGGPASGKNGGIYKASNITGSSVNYCGGGAGNGHPPDGGSSGTSYRTAIGGGGNAANGAGTAGTVIVAYRIG